MDFIILVGILLFIGLVMILFFLHKHKYDIDEDVDDIYDTNSTGEAIYNTSPVNWEKINYKNPIVENKINNDLYKNIVIIESNLIIKKQLNDILSDGEFNLYFFDNGNDFLESNIKIVPNMIIASDDLKIINGIKLFNILNKEEKYKETKFVILTINNKFYLGTLDGMILKPLDKELVKISIKNLIK